MKEKKCWFIIAFTLFSWISYSQTTNDSTHFPLKKRQWLVGSTLVAGYTTSTILLNDTWYKDYPRSSFHFFNDWGEWNNMDKLGHVFSSQFQSIYAYHLFKWSGLSEDQSIMCAAVTSLAFQSTIETLDGFSTEWGFSLTDYTANIFGVSLFVLQQKHWQEQRILMKVSGGRKDYPDIAIVSNQGNTSILLDDRADALFGSSIPTRFLKDYNAQTIWFSINLQSIFNAERVPSWLNASVGFGSENMFGGFENQWTDNGESFEIRDENLTRYRQYYLSPDIDLTKIRVKKKGWKTLLGILNIFKVPLPALEINSRGEFKFHPLKF